MEERHSESKREKKTGWIKSGFFPWKPSSSSRRSSDTWSYAVTLDHLVWLEWRTERMLSSIIHNLQARTSGYGTVEASRCAHDLDRLCWDPCDDRTIKGANHVSSSTRGQEDCERGWCWWLSPGGGGGLGVGGWRERGDTKHLQLK